MAAILELLFVYRSQNFSVLWNEMQDKHICQYNIPNLCILNDFMEKSCFYILSISDLIPSLLTQEAA